MRFVLILFLILLPASVLADTRPPAPPAEQQARPDHPGWSIDEATGCFAECVKETTAQGL